ncbi:MAG: hypothetical protein ACO1OX_05535 [Novosphingobium sp.]
MKSVDLPLDNLILDPNNYRLQDESGYAAIAKSKYYLENVQNAAEKLLKKEGLKELRDSFVSNGFLPIERIVVTPYNTGLESEPEEAKNKYLVIEGNRRVASLKIIQDEIVAGVEIPTSVGEMLQRIPCIVVDQDGQTEYFKETLMGIRHVGGIRQWGGYQRAKLIADLKNNFKIESTEVAAKLGLSVQEVNRRFRAFSALEQMKDDEEYGDYAKPSMYPLFHEAVSLPAVRDWLSWNSDSNRFEDIDKMHQFYHLMTPSYDDETGSESNAKLTTYSDVRQLKDILPNPEAKQILLDDDRTFEDAKIVSGREKLSKKWRTEISEAISSLKNIGALEVKNLSSADMNLISELIDTAASIKSIREALSKNSA